VDFKFDQWLHEGAIIGKVGKWVEAFWGSAESLASESDLGKRPAIYQSNFFHESPRPWKTFAKSQRFEWKEWRALMLESAKPKSSEETPDLDWQDPSESDFKKTFNDIKKDIRSGKIIKAVPVVYSKAARSGGVEVPLFHALKQSPKNTYIYGSWSQQGGSFGFTPEVLFLSENEKKVKTMALAGTRQKEAFAQDPESFLRDPKELREHQIVVDDIVERLQPFGKIKVSKTASLELNYLAHLYTPIQLIAAEDFSFEKLVDLLHPTPALGISPRSQAELLRKWRDAKDILGAPFGVRWSASSYLCVVAIRQLQWDDKFFYIGNGCGIVAESEFEDEWYELKIKRDSVRRMFRL